MNSLISIREHCIPAYDELYRMNEVYPFPEELSQMEQKTAGGIIAKLEAVYKSNYFKNLPSFATIKSGGNQSYLWDKQKAEKEIQRIIALK
jgi:hypothetical protein